MQGLTWQQERKCKRDGVSTP